MWYALQSPLHFLSENPHLTGTLRAAFVAAPARERHGATPRSPYAAGDNPASIGAVERFPSASSRSCGTLRCSGTYRYSSVSATGSGRRSMAPDFSLSVRKFHHVVARTSSALLAHTWLSICSMCCVSAGLRERALRAG